MAELVSKVDDPTRDHALIEHYARRRIARDRVQLAIAALADRCPEDLDRVEGDARLRAAWLVYEAAVAHRVELGFQVDVAFASGIPTDSVTRHEYAVAVEMERAAILALITLRPAGQPLAASWAIVEGTCSRPDGSRQRTKADVDELVLAGVLALVDTRPRDACRVLDRARARAFQLGGGVGDEPTKVSSSLVRRWRRDRAARDLN